MYLFWVGGVVFFGARVGFLCLLLSGAGPPTLAHFMMVGEGLHGKMGGLNYKNSRCWEILQKDSLSCSLPGSLWVGNKTIYKMTGLLCQ